MDSWRRDFLRGVALVGPLLVVVALCWLAYRWVADVGLFPASLPAPVRVVLTVLVVGVVLVVTGRVMRTAFGPTLDRTADAGANRVPVVRVVYNAVKSAMATLLSGDPSLRRPVKVETWPGLWMTGFRTGTRTADGTELLFVPGSPDPTSGLVVTAAPEHIEETDESRSSALMRIVSCGFGGEEGTGPDEDECAGGRRRT